MTDTTALAVANRYFDALGEGDMQTVMSLFAPTVVWHQPGDNQFSGEHRGVDGVGSLLGNMMSVSQGTFQLTLEGSMMVNGSTVAVPVRFAGTRDSHSMDMAGIDLLTIDEGKIVSVHLYSSDGAAEDAFWGKA